MEDKEINDVVLEEVTGGLETSEEPPSLRCPRCSGTIYVTIHELLTAEYIECPHCSLRLKIDKNHRVEQP